MRPSGVSGLGIAFQPAESQRADLEHFVEGIQRAEHTRRLGGITGADTEEDDPSKLETTVLELVRAGFTVGRIVEVIPEPEPEIYRALVSLSESGAISL